MKQTTQEYFKTFRFLIWPAVILMIYYMFNNSAKPGSNVKVNLCKGEIHMQQEK